jgi:NAD(P)-dependent dehydrogenase (short-subunit alcohol dehydrogenase family)
MSRESERHRVLVTGAARGIGATVARRLAAQGAFVALADLSDQTQVVTQEIVTGGGRAAAYKTDVTAPQSIERVLDAVEKDAGGLVDMAGQAINADGGIEMDWRSGAA